MSRKWERMVERNAKKSNKLRQKQGKPALTRQADFEIVKGRSLVLPIAFLLIALFFLLTAAPDTSGSYWFTVLSYPALAALYYFVYRPYLKIGKDWLGVRRWFIEQRIAAADVKSVIRSGGHIVLEYNKQGKTSRLVFSKVLNLYPIEKLDESLRRFAAQHGVRYELERK
ncbi:hypothetical protein ACFQWB_12835 [Paenibacillus thermoaerophilus]|uniref:PH domain-containing protein n=1 Tax=Paenibacillus thermoaerophilus TaxID=1215385 RepID=A0ABW2V6E5_9BACL